MGGIRKNVSFIFHGSSFQLFGISEQLFCSTQSVRVCHLLLKRESCSGVEGKEAWDSLGPLVGKSDRLRAYLSVWGAVFIVTIVTIVTAVTAGGCRHCAVFIVTIVTIVIIVTIVTALGGKIALHKLKTNKTSRLSFYLADTGSCLLTPVCFPCARVPRCKNLLPGRCPVR